MAYVVFLASALAALGLIFSFALVYAILPLLVVSLAMNAYLYRHRAIGSAAFVGNSAMVFAIVCNLVFVMMSTRHVCFLKLCFL